VLYRKHSAATALKGEGRSTRRSVFDTATWRSPGRRRNTMASGRIDQRSATSQRWVFEADWDRVFVLL